jgi:hypothetical protein
MSRGLWTGIVRLVFKNIISSLAIQNRKTEKKFVKFGGTKQNIQYIKSSDSNLLIPKTGTTAKKPGQK